MRLFLILLMMIVCEGNTKWLYDGVICTGLGDRLGFVISLSALARLNNGTVFMEWCEDGQRAPLANALHLVYIPRWTGYDYPLETIREHFTLPSNVEFYPDGRPATYAYKLVSSGNQAPAIEGIPHTRTLYYKALKFGDREWSRDEYEQAYFDAGSEITWKGQAKAVEPFVLVHFRCPDHNSYITDVRSFCTRRVIRRLHNAGVDMKIITNDYNLTMLWMEGLPSVDIVQTGTAWTDLQLAFEAVAIVQHASWGWSSYTSVPAMAKATPLINTYKGNSHRFDFFKQYGDLPAEVFSCKQLKEFVRTVRSRLQYL